MPFSDRIGAWSMTAMFSDGPLSRHVALVAAAGGRLDEAERQWSSAEAVARADDQRPILVHIQRAESLGDRDLAKTARDEAEALGLSALAARADRLLGGVSRPPSSKALPSASVIVSLEREGDTWSIRGAGESARLKDSRGLQMLSVLVGHAGREIAAVELDASPSASTPIDLGDAGEAIDDRARHAYKTRIRDLESEIAEAEQWNDSVRLASAKGELDSLKSELARAIGLGGQARRAGSTAERARTNVQRRITDAIKRIAAVCPEVGRHLSATVRTGTTCWYDPTSRKRPSAR
jgi:hypothetical protein